MKGAIVICKLICIFILMLRVQCQGTGMQDTRMKKFCLDRMGTLRPPALPSGDALTTVKRLVSDTRIR
jgi:hypothetical protein